MARSFVAGTSSLSLGSALLTAAPLTMVGRYRPTNAGTGGTVLSLGGVATGNQFSLVIGASGSLLQAKASIQASGTTDSTAVGPPIGRVGAWMHLMAVYTSATSRQAFTNGVPGNVSAVNLTPASLSDTRIGRTYHAGGLFQNADGPMEDVALWNAALTAAEGMAIALGAPIPVMRPASLVAYYALRGGASESSDVGAANTLTNNATTPWSGRRGMDARFLLAGGIAGNVAPTGVAAIAAVGSVAATGAAAVAPSGVSATGAVGTASASGAAAVAPAGAFATGVVGTPTATGGGGATANPTGVFATGAVGTLTPSGAAVASPQGVSAVAVVGVVTASGSSTPAGTILVTCLLAPTVRAPLTLAPAARVTAQLRPTVATPLLLQPRKAA